MLQASVSLCVFIFSLIVGSLFLPGSPDALAADSKHEKKIIEVTAPESKIMVVNDTLDIVWAFKGGIRKVDVAWTTDGNYFYEFGIPLENIPAEGATDGCLDPGESGGCVRTRVPDAVSSTFRVRVRDAEERTCLGLSGTHTVDSNVVVHEPLTILDTLTPKVVSSEMSGNEAPAVFEQNPAWTWKQTLQSESPGEFPVILDAKDALGGVQKALKGDGDTGQALENFKKSILRLPSRAVSRREEWADIHRTLEDAFQFFEGEIRGRGIGAHFLEGEIPADGMRGIRFHVDRLALVIQVLQRVTKASASQDERLIVEYFYGIGSVLLKIVVVNPSPKKYQILPLNVYLPYEIIPDDIISTHNLKIGYDPTRKLYYAFNEHIELKPLEGRLFEIALEDIWKIPRREIDQALERSQRLLHLLKGNEHFPQAESMANSVQQRLARILIKQTDESVSQEEHIQIYREQVKLMKQIEEEIKQFEDLALYLGAATPRSHLQFTTFEEEKAGGPEAAKFVPALFIGIGFSGLGFYFLWFLSVHTRRAGKTQNPPAPLEHEEEKKVL